MIGSGPAGMRSALLLAKAGFSVELFEKEPLPGGMLRYYLPRFRFRLDGLEARVKRLKELGVKIHLNSWIGRVIKLHEIVERFDAVVLAPGEWRAKRLGIPGEWLDGVSYWTEFLRKYNEGSLNSLDGKRLVVIGAGDTAMDCARVALRLNASVFIAYRRGRKRMPAMKREAKAAEREGARFLFNLSPLKFLGGETLEAVLFEKTRENRGIVGTGETVELKANGAVIAIGQEPDLSIFNGSPFKGFDDLPEKVFLAGDIVNEEKLIANAVASAERAVEKIKNMLGD